MKNSNTKQGIPLLIIVILAIIMISEALFTNVYLSTAHYLGFIFTLICLLLFFINLNIFKIALATTLVLGTLNLLTFTVSIITFDSSINFKYPDTSLNISFQPLSLALLIFFIMLNFNEIKSLFLKSEEEKEEEEILIKNHWKNKFGNKSTEELMNLISEKGRLVQEANDAIKEILESRKKRALTEHSQNAGASTNIKKGNFE